MLERLQKILSRAGIASRRHAEAAILSGRVKVNGKIVRELGVKADPAADSIEVDGKALRQPESKHRYFAYYKPRGVVVSKSDPQGRKTVFDLLRLPPEVNAVGRLDKESEGLLLLTDDGEFLQRYTHPSFEIRKVYQVQVSRPLEPEERRRLLGGIELEEKRVKALQLKRIPSKGGLWIEITLGEGVKREIRRMLEAVGIRVLRLIRVRHGEIVLGSLQPGQMVEIQPVKPPR
ncbi:MAG TPA: pseudouridine synthase [bacterium]|nr:pseudouridine synthase [bacterium]